MLDQQVRITPLWEPKPPDPSPQLSPKCAIGLYTSLTARDMRPVNLFRASAAAPTQPSTGGGMLGLDKQYRPTPPSVVNSIKLKDLPMQLHTSCDANQLYLARCLSQVMRSRSRHDHVHSFPGMPRHLQRRVIVGKSACCACGRMALPATRAVYLISDMLDCAV